MTENRHQGPPKGESREPTRKKAYEPPQVVFREPLEAMAIICTPSPPGKDAGLCSSPSS